MGKCIGRNWGKMDDKAPRGFGGEIPFPTTKKVRFSPGLFWLRPYTCQEFFVLDWRPVAVTMTTTDYASQARTGADWQTRIARILKREGGLRFEGFSGMMSVIARAYYECLRVVPQTPDWGGFAPLNLTRSQQTTHQLCIGICNEFGLIQIRVQLQTNVIAERMFSVSNNSMEPSRMD